MDRSLEQLKRNQSTGITYAIVTFVAWGVLPVFWKQLDSVSAMEILAHRIFWSFVIVTFFVLISGKLKELKQVLSKRSSWLPTLISSLLNSTTWFLYIWAVNSNHILETSLGYYINPLISIILGMVIYQQ